MIDTKDSHRAPGHRLTAGDTPAYGLPVEHGSGGRRRRAGELLGIDPTPTDGIDAGDAVLWHDRAASVAETFPAPEDRPWLGTMCRIAFVDGGADVYVGRDELELNDEADGARFFTPAPVVLEDTGPLPSPVPRDADGPATEQFAAVGELPEAEREQDRHGWWRRVVLTAFLDVLWRTWLLVVWPFRRLARSVVGDFCEWLVDEVSTVVEAVAVWERWHSRLVAKLLLAMLSAGVFAGAGVLWVLR